MYNTLLFLHSLLRWIILLLAIIAIWRSWSGMTGNKPFAPADYERVVETFRAAGREALLTL